MAGERDWFAARRSVDLRHSQALAIEPLALFRADYRAGAAGAGRRCHQRRPWLDRHRERVRARRLQPPVRAWHADGAVARRQFRGRPEHGRCLCRSPVSRPLRHRARWGWVGRVVRLSRRRHSRTEVAAAFLASPQAQPLAVQADAQFVTSLFNGLLGHAPDAGQLAGFTTALAGGGTRAEVVDALAQSAESQAYLAKTTTGVWIASPARQTADLVLTTGLGHESTVAVTAAGGAALLGCLSVLQYAAEVASTPEFAARARWSKLGRLHHRSLHDRAGPSAECRRSRRWGRPGLRRAGPSAAVGGDCCLTRSRSFVDASPLTGRMPSRRLIATTPARVRSPLRLGGRLENGRNRRRDHHRLRCATGRAVVIRVLDDGRFPLPPSQANRRNSKR